VKTGAVWKSPTVWNPLPYLTPVGSCIKSRHCYTGPGSLTVQTQWVV